MKTDESHTQQTEDRKKYILSIVESTADKKIVVSGPGTGKTSTFQDVLKKKPGRNLALTFIKNLALDLQNDLNELAESYTFHAYCKKLLHKIKVDGINTDFFYFPKLSKIIEADSIIMEYDYTNFDEAFRTLSEGELIEFYLEQGNYYNAVDYNDAVYRVLKYFQSNPEHLPSFDQIVVDEYQDFVPLEVSFIDELSKKSPVLIAGDDDQAIYDFRNASPEYIREKFKDDTFEAFELPYCSRSTQVIVDAVEDIVNEAKKHAKLEHRVEKKFICYLPKKEEDSVTYPQIIHARCSVNNAKAPYIAKYIEHAVSKIPQQHIDDANKRGCPCVLIAGPAHYTKQINDYLKDKFSNIDYPSKSNQDIEILDGYRILMQDESANLGWRIILECTTLDNKAKIIKSAHETSSKLIDIIPDDFKNDHLGILKLFLKLKTGEMLSEEESAKITKKSKLPIEEIQKKLNLDQEEEIEADEEEFKITIKITTINGSKGLSANYVFLIGLNNGDLPKNNDAPTDNEICQFIVGMSRTRKECHLISNRLGFGSFDAKTKKPIPKEKSIFIDWIDSERITHTNVNKDFWK